MPEPCVNDPERECRSATRLALLEKRVELLESGQKKESQFRDVYYESQREQIRRDAELDAKIGDIDEKLSKMIAWQEAQQEKPVKRWDRLVEWLICAVAGAVVAWIAAGAPGM